MDQLPDDHFVTATQFTRKAYRDVYPAIDPSSPTLSQAGRVAIITGASRGLGARGIAPAFAKAGPKGIVLVARDSEKLKDTEAAIKTINPKVETLLVSADIADPASVKNLFDQVAAKFGHADILINNAGVMHDLQPFKDVNFDWWQKEFSINASGTLLVSQAFLRQLPEGTQASIITLNTTASYLTLPAWATYGISKLASLQLMAYIALENPNVTAVSLSPGIADTDMVQPIMKKFAKDTPELTGGAAVWLCTEGARFLSGRYTMAGWDVVELKEREEEIKQKALLKVDLTGTFGPEQFDGKSEVIV